MPAAARRVDEILALGGEEAGLVALLALPRSELAHELQLRVVARGDHVRASRPEPSRAISEPATLGGRRVGCLASAAFACSAISANAFGSATARSASDLRSSSIPALCRPA